MITKHFSKILRYYIVLIVSITVALLAIEGLNIYHFDAQLGMAVVVWGLIGFVVLLAVLSIVKLIALILKRRKTSN